MTESAVGPYRVIGRLGSGGMGEVLLCQDTRLHRKVALKSLTAADAEQGALRERILSEARAAARLNHPNIAAVYDVVEQDDRAFIVMEYVEGESLARCLARERLPIDRVIDIGRQLASALDAAHAQGVIHRDLKPANVQLTPTGSVKILDFGVARMTAPVASPDATTVSAPTAASVVPGNAGTPVYMAPEQLVHGHTDARSDLYSLGVMLFEMATGRRPFQDEGTIALAVTVSSTPAPAADTVNPSVPLDLSAVIARTLERDLEQRYPSAAALEAGLALIGSHVDLLASSSDAAASRPDTFMRRRPRLTLIAAAVVILLSVGAATLVNRIWMNRPLSGPSSAAPVPVVAVLPLTNLSGETSIESLGAGIVDVLVSNLARVQGVTVVPRSATTVYRDRDRDVKRIARDLGATYLVDGGVQRSGNAIRVTMNLLSVATGAVAWSQTYDGTVADVFALQRRLGEALTDALRLALTPDDRQRLGRAPTTNVEAFADYSQGRSFLERSDVRGNVERAVQLFQQAIRRDPQFVLAHAALGDAFWERYQATKEAQWTERAMTSILEALRLDPDQPQVRVSLARIYQGTGRNDAAIKELERVLPLQPNSDEVRRLLGTMLETSGQTPGAIDQYRRAIELRPNYWQNHYDLGVLYYRLGRYDEAERTFGRVTELQPDNARGFHMLGMVQHALGHPAAALRNYNEAVRLGPIAQTYSNIGTIHYREGRFVEAAHAYQQALKLRPNSEPTYRNLGDAYRRLGQTGEATAAYRKAVELGEEALKVNPRDARTLATVALCEAKLGLRLAAEKRAAEALALRPDDSEVLYKKAAVHALNGQATPALDALKRALAHGYSARLANEDDDLSAIKRLPAFDALVGR